jgi:hypothetical protein
MLGKVIVGYDGSDEARDALALGRLLADLASARLILAAVLPVKEEAIGREGYEAAMSEDSERLFATVLGDLERPGRRAASRPPRPSTSWPSARAPTRSSSDRPTGARSAGSIRAASPSASSTVPRARWRSPRGASAPAGMASCGCCA